MLKVKVTEPKDAVVNISMDKRTAGILLAIVRGCNIETALDNLEDITVEGELEETVEDIVARLEAVC
jgi:hypothetical protein